MQNSPSQLRDAANPQEIINGISACIYLKLKSLAAEWCYPELSGDQMDEKIQRLTEDVKALKKIREDFEHTMTGAPR